MSLVKLVGSVVSQLAQGTPLWKISMPASIHMDQTAVTMFQKNVANNCSTLRCLDTIDTTHTPMERIALVLLSFLDPYIPFTSDKPFNSVLGEFVEMVLKPEQPEYPEEEYYFECEQVSHHPPLTAYRIKGKHFEVTTPDFLDSGTFKFGFNSLEIHFSRSRSLVKTRAGNFEYIFPSLKIENLFGKRTIHMNGDFYILDPSGLRLEGKITKGGKITGVFMDNGKKIDSISGDLIKGIVLQSTKKIWAKSVAPAPVKKIVPEQVLNDPLYAENVWGQVLKYMRLPKPDFENADKEKINVENLQREKAKEGVAFVSRFGFVDATIKEQ
ncbi:hypothetical protein EDD86DRAFT_218479 [Gorgonomyces haynaldii]|nr:hypothetical protein EDD86DRAFT_218479 [Gorgonomyces haynaldii]